MMTQNSSCSRIVAVWLVLLAFLCCTMVPSLAVASKDMEIESEGDPEDGLDSSGGGGGFSIGDNDQSSSQSLDSDIDQIPFVFYIYPNFNVFLISPIYILDTGQFSFLIDYQWRAKH